MKKLPNIARIIKVEPFKITMIWSTLEVRVLDFAPLFEIWEAEADANVAALRDWKTFKKVTISENHTLCWPNVLVPFTFKGKKRSEPLELDAQELYRQSKLVGKVEKLHIGAMIRQARKKAGLTQAKVAFNSGTTPKYISRIENDKSDIQLGTLHKIVELGMGQKMFITIGESTGRFVTQKKETTGSKRKRTRKVQGA
ncbi:MAG: hypothetical protein EPGJADBJ_02695 [Saprospiraceae bacterium]|nr:hypothetical protein [Saprospiraceae bacterium]